jgi:hypothetical protein
MKQTILVNPDMDNHPLRRFRPEETGTTSTYSVHPILLIENPGIVGSSKGLDFSDAAS